MLFYCASLSHFYGPQPTAYWLITSLGTFVLTALIPLSLMIIRFFTGTITTIQIRNPKERTAVYAYALVCYFFWCYFLLGILHAPISLFFIAVGATLALSGVLVINHYWKISAHLTGLGGLIGGVCAYCLCNGLPLPLKLITCLLIVSLIVMYARLYTNEHTPLQVVVGLLYGLTITSLPAIIYNLFAHA